MDMTQRPQPTVWLCQCLGSYQNQVLFQSTLIPIQGQSPTLRQEQFTYSSRVPPQVLIPLFRSVLIPVSDLQTLNKKTITILFFEGRAPPAEGQRGPI